LEFDEQAFQNLYPELCNMLGRYLSRRKFPEADVEDMIAETVAQLTDQWHKLRNLSELDAWAIHHLKLEVSHYWRRKATLKRAPELQDHETYRVAADQMAQTHYLSPEKALINHEDEHLAMQCLGTLPKKMKRIFTLRVADEHIDEDAIAATFRITPATVRSQLSQARKRLASCIERLRAAGKAQRG